ncbi:MULTISPECIES: S9 family peptidase [unclassified Dysgonomonas]|jgi:dipeptidyl-peptidase-4|uniref:S9 family peptidase n=1 Tax=unclassified Dysgonomonas TaxID=2630389 RepID=UPI0025C63E10|nr:MULTISPECIES: S9 family peptidase [unclassified Dysgonomonas]MDR2003512.1 S9 family peptidase [Prevotella sp.]HMM02750.1 S9 family peptidase [Dysgonomonas sp.]
MKFINSVFLAISILLPMKSHSQEIPLTLEDLTPGGKTFSKYRAEMPRQLGWHGDKLTYIKGDSVMIAPNTDKEKPQVLLSLQDINSGMRFDKDESLKSLNTIQFISPESNDILIATPDKIYLYDFVAKKIVATFLSLDKMNNHDWAEKSRMLAYTKDNNLYIQDSEGKETAITSETNPGIVCGQSVHRNEFGINKGIFWSPAGNLLAFYRMDETMVTDYPLVDISARIAKLKDIKYPMAGMKSHHVTVGVYNPVTQQTVYLKTGTPKEKYLTNIAWSPDEKSIYIAEVNRGQDTCIVKSYDAATGKLQTTLFTETHPKYVEPENPVLFLKNDPSKFLWQSERDGFNHLYLYDTTGKLLKQITSGKWDVTSILGFDEKSENLFYVSTEASPIEKHIYKLNLKTGKREQLSKEEGVHDGMLSASGKYICDRYTSQNNPGKVTITETKSNKSYVYYSAKDPYRNVQLPEITLGKLKANDNATDLYYRLVKPLNFDPDKKYPVIVYVYGGPHSQMVDNSWMGQVRGWDIYMAEKGYVVFTMDNRGTSNRGIDFENITHCRLGVVETEDQMTGVEYLKSLAYVDAGRIGVHGWSYGGFMTLNLMLRHPETFKVGVAGGPVTDWKYYEVMYGERYMDSPQENQEGYKNSSMVERAGDLKGRLMLIHGDEDPTVVMQQSLQFLHSAIKKGTHPDFFIYPGHGHNMTGHDRVHLHEHITRYFDDFLK